MAYEVGTQGANGLVKRGSGIVNFNAAYTVLFSLYIPVTTPLYHHIWGISGTSGTGGPSFGDRFDRIKLKSNGVPQLDLWDGTDGGQVDFSGAPTLGVGWHYFAVIRSALNSIKIRARLNGAGSSTDYASSAADMTGREATAYEYLFGEGDTNNMAAGTRMTNYKAWSAALSDSDVDSEWFSTAFTVTSNKWSGSPMSDEASASGNATADGSGTNWTTGSTMTFGTNNPGISYGSSFIPRRMMLGVG